MKIAEIESSIAALDGKNTRGPRKVKRAEIRAGVYSSSLLFGLLHTPSFCISSGRVRWAVCCSVEIRPRK